MLTKHREGKDGRNEGCIRDWYYKELLAPGRAEFDVLLRKLIERPGSEWDRPDYSPLSSPHKGIAELRFKANGIQYRPLGFFLPPHLRESDRQTQQSVEEFVILVGAFKKGEKWSPREARETAVDRRLLILKEGRIHVARFIDFAEE